MVVCENMSYEIENNNLIIDSKIIFENIAEDFSITPDGNGKGVFLTANFVVKSCESETRLGSICGFERFVSVSRKNPYFATAFTGDTVKDIPLETQWLLVKRTDGSYVVILPLLDEPVRACVKGNANGDLVALFETGSTKTKFKKACAIYIGIGTNPYEIIKDSAVSVANKMKTVRLRKDKKLPGFMKYFGWCTWDSFYTDVSEKKVLNGLQSFKPAGFVPKFLLIDDGWQTTQKMTDSIGNNRLSDFICNEKFYNSLSGVVTKVKNDFDVELVYVWHAVYGYWGGVSIDSNKMTKYEPSLQPYGHTKDMVIASDNEWTGGYVSEFPSVPPEKFFDFYNNYHSYLRKEGIDGVKVDVQCLIETVAENCGGRVRNARKCHEALEASVGLNFKGELINCMSTSNDIILSTLNSNMMRSSDDFFPNKPESHGEHIYRNTINSIFMGEFTHTDWDMFQTGHEAGEFHAVSRAVSGCPIYVSDKPDNHNFDIIRKLTTFDGEVFLSCDIAKPTIDCLFSNPFKEDILFKIFNYNKFGGVIGVFNVQYSEETPKIITGSVKPSDIAGFDVSEFAVYSFFEKKLRKLSASDKINLTLCQLKSEIFTVVKIENGFAPIGLVNKYNSGGAILDINCNQVVTIALKDGGKFVAYCDKNPTDVKLNRKSTDFTYRDNMLVIEISSKGKTNVEIYF